MVGLHLVLRRLSVRTLVTAAAAGIILTACAPAGAPQPAASGSGEAVVLVSGTAAEPAPELTGAAAATLDDLAQNDEATATVMTAHGISVATLPLSPRRPNGQVEHGQRRASMVEQNLGAVRDVMAGVRADRPGLDLLDALSTAVRGREPGTLLVVSSGVSTDGGLDLRQIPWGSDPAEVVTQLRRQELLPHLFGWRVLFTGLADTAGDQPALPAPSHDELVRLWVEICRSAGAASCDVDDVARPLRPPSATANVPVVAVPTVQSVQTNGRTTTTVPDALLGFAADSAFLGPGANEVLAGVAAGLAARPEQTPVTVRGYTADPPGSTTRSLEDLSLRRALAVRDALQSMGVAATVDAEAGGVAPGPSSMEAGHYDPVRAAQMRRVEITS